MSDEGDRLQRIENKLDNVERALVSLARIEERMSGHVEGMERLGGRIDEHEKRMRTLELSVQSNTGVSRWMERLAWVIITGVVIMWIKQA